jgi:hypothetical protein
LDGGDDFTRGSLDVEIDGFASIAWELAVETELEATGFDLVLQVVILVVDFVDDVAACPWVSDLSDVLTLAVFNIGDGQFRSVTAEESALAWSVEHQERFVIEGFTVVFEVNLELERSAVTSHALLGEAAGLFLGLEELLALLVTILA